AHEQTLIAVPPPHPLETNGGLGGERREQIGGEPRLAAVAAHVDATDGGATAPGEPANRPPARAAQLFRIRRRRDERFRVHLEAEDARLSIGERIGGLRRLTSRLALPGA